MKIIAIFLSIIWTLLIFFVVIPTVNKLLSGSSEKPIEVVEEKPIGKEKVKDIENNQNVKDTKKDTGKKSQDIEILDVIDITYFEKKNKLDVFPIDKFDEMSESEKLEFLLSKKLENFKIKTRTITSKKYDISFSVDLKKDENILDVFKKICETIVQLEYKDKLMEIVVTFNTEENTKKIITVKDFSRQLLPVIKCSVFENGKLLNKSITIKIK